MAEVEAVRPDDVRKPSDSGPDVVIVDDESRRRRANGAPPEELYPDSLVLRLRDDAYDAAGAEVEGHFRSREHGYVRREDLEEIAPVIVALAGLSRAAGRKAAP
jgi:hypothetical protein